MVHRRRGWSGGLGVDCGELGVYECFGCGVALIFGAAEVQGDHLWAFAREGEFGRDDDDICQPEFSKAWRSHGSR